MKTAVPYRDELVEAAIRQSVGDYIKTKPQATRDAWRFGCVVIYAGVNVDNALATIPSPRPLSPAAEAELNPVLDDIAALVDDLLNPPEAATRRAFVVSATAANDKLLGLALTNAADDETFAALIGALTRAAPPLGVQ